MLNSTICRDRVTLWAFEMKNLALILGSIMFAFILAEIGVTMITNIIYPRLVISDPVLGWKYKPTSDPVERRFSESITYSISINSDGFRDDEFRLNDQFKVMLLGDSMTFGMEVGQKEIFSYLIEQNLIDSMSTNKVDVMNFGIPGYSTAQELICFEYYAPIVKPDMAILMLFEQNDFWDNALYFSSGKYRPHYVLENDELKLVNSPTRFERLVGSLRDKSTIFALLPLKKINRQYKLTKDERIVLMKEILGRMHAYARKLGIPFVVYYIRDPDKRAIFSSRDPAIFSEEIKNYAKKASIRMVEIPLLKEERVENIGHWNVDGHKHVAKIIMETLGT